MQLTQAISKWTDRCLSFLGRQRKASQEPKDAPTVIFTLPDGRKLTMEDLQGLTGRVYVRDGKLLDVTGTVRFEIIGKGTVSRAAEALHQQAREAGGAVNTRKPSRFWSGHRSSRRTGLTPSMTERSPIC